MIEKLGVVGAAAFVLFYVAAFVCSLALPIAIVWGIYKLVTHYAP